MNNPMCCGIMVKRARLHDTTRASLASMCKLSYLGERKEIIIRRFRRFTQIYRKRQLHNAHNMQT